MPVSAASHRPIPWLACAGLVGQGEDVELQLVGKPPQDLAPFRTLLGDRFVATGYVAHADSVRLVAGAAVLVNFLDVHRSASWLLSTKMFEYLACGRPVVVANPSRSDRLLLRRVSGVRVLWQPGVEELKEALGAALREPARADPAGVERFHSEFNWTDHARQLAGELDELVSFPPAEVSRPAPGAPAASMVIPTRNRKDLLGRMIRSALAQTVPVEVIVMDDGSTDGTQEMVRREFPQVRYYELGKAKGPAF